MKIKYGVNFPITKTPTRPKSESGVELLMSTGSEAGCLFPSELPHLLAMRPWACYSASLGLSFLT